GALAGATDAGVYNAVLRLVLAGTLTMQALRIGIAPQLSRLLTSGERTGDLSVATHVHQTATTWVVLLSWPLYVVFAVWPREILALFGAEFQVGASSLLILAVAMLWNLGTGNVGTVLL